jgi:thymidine kinase
VGRLRFSFGTMGSGKSTVALQIHHNLRSAGRSGLLLTRFDREGGQVTSRLGVAQPAIDIDPDFDLLALAAAHQRHEGLHFVVVDEAQFLTSAQVDELAAIADDLEVDVYAFGLLTDFRGKLFEGSMRLLEVADERHELQVEARCWCGERATHNARLVNGALVREGDVVVVGDTTPVGDRRPLFGDVVSYELVCRRHYRRGEMGPTPS